MPSLPIQNLDVYLRSNYTMYKDMTDCTKRLMTLFILMLCIKVSGASFADGYNVRTLNMSDGLGHIFVDDMLIDSDGFLWIATAGGGLSRYDSYGFVEFGPDKENRLLKGNFVIKISEDTHRRLWVASREGLDVVDLDMMTDVIPADRTGRLQDLMAKRTFYVSTDALGRVWINNIDGLACVTLDSGSGDVTDISLLEGVYHEPNLLVVEDILSDGMPWVLIGGTVYRLKPNGDGTIGMVPVSDKLSFRLSDIAASSFALKDGDVWIGTNYGLIRYNPLGDNIRHYRSDRSDIHSLSHDYVTSIVLAPEGRLFVGNTDGIDIYNAMDDNFEKFVDDMPGDNRLQFVNCLLADGRKLWVGTERKGIRLYVPRKLGLRTFVHDAADDSSLSPSPINAVYQDASGGWWLGTSEYGLSKTDSQFGRFDNYYPWNSEISHNSITSITADGEGNVWIGMWGRGIDVVKPGEPGRVLKHIETPVRQEMMMKFITMLFYDSINELMWVSTNQGLMTYDIRSGEIREPFPKASTSDSWMLGGVVDSGGILWLGGKYGLYKINLKGRKPDGYFDVKHYMNRLDNPASKELERISSLCLAGDGTLWVGSNGNGLYRRNVSDNGVETFTRFSTKDGLPGNIITGLHEDADRRLWVVTTKGLACRQNDGTYISYDSSDGMLSNLFCENASAMGSDGRLVFGTTDGLVVVDPALTAVKSESNNKVRFTNLTVDGVEVPMHPASNSGGLLIHERDKALEIGFSALDYEKSRYSEGRYYCWLKGFDQVWDTLPEGRHHARYTNLPPGKYTFEVKYVANGAIADDVPVSSMPVEVTPYFYRRWWFITLAVMIVCALTGFIYRWRVNDLTRQKNNLQNTVDKRTREISEQKHLLELQNQQLRTANAEVTNQKVQLSEMVEKVQALTTERINFFTSITHEFRTPVTLISGPIKRALKLSSNPRVIEQLVLVEQNSRYLLSLINQIMDFRKVEAGRMDVAIHSGDFMDFLKKIFDSFCPMAYDLGVEMRLLTHVPGREFCFAEEAMRKVLVNLISNALKYTPRGGQVTLYAALTGCHVLAGGRNLYICVSDTGRGISEADMDHLFDRFYQGDSSPLNPVGGTSGSGIGLYLCKNIVETCGGTIEARNNKVRGCSMRVLIPVEPEEIMTRQNASEPSELTDTMPDKSCCPDQALKAALTVLVVDDNTAMRRFIRSVLESRYAVVEASNGREALDLLVHNAVDFIITDLMMPVMDGHELSRRLKNDISTSHIPVLILTAKASVQTRTESYRIGVDEYLSKPFDEDMLIARVANILDNKRRYQSRFMADMDVDNLNVVDNSLDRRFLDRLMAVVKDNYKNSEFEVADVEEALGVGRNILNQKLQSIVGQSAWQFIRTYRLNVAHDMIIKNRRSRTLNISEIAYEVGFSDPKYFSKSFSKHFGMSPRSFLNEEK